jgi:hypothetical protein
MTTLNLISEQIVRNYSRFIDKDNEKIDIREVKRLVSSVVNKLFKLEHTQVRDIVGTAIGTYTYTTEEGDNYFLNLTVTPISLAKEMGVHRVYREGCPNKPFIPIQSGDFDIVQGTPSEYLEGQTGYWLEGSRIVFTSNPGEKVICKLIVFDPDANDGNALLPVPSDMEQDVISNVLQLIGVGQVGQAELNSKHEREATNERER